MQSAQQVSTSLWEDVHLICVLQSNLPKLHITFTTKKSYLYIVYYKPIIFMTKQDFFWWKFSPNMRVELCYQTCLLQSNGVFSASFGCNSFYGKVKSLVS